MQNEYTFFICVAAASVEHVMPCKLCSGGLQQPWNCSGAHTTCTTQQLHMYMPAQTPGCGYNLCCYVEDNNISSTLTVKLLTHSHRCVTCTAGHQRI
jgi:hypothetical protein